MGRKDTLFSCSTVDLGMISDQEFKSQVLALLHEINGKLSTLVPDPKPALATKGTKLKPLSELDRQIVQLLQPKIPKVEEYVRTGIKHWPKKMSKEEQRVRGCIHIAQCLKSISFLFYSNL